MLLSQSLTVVKAEEDEQPLKYLSFHLLIVKLSKMYLGENSWHTENKWYYKQFVLSQRSS